MFVGEVPRETGANLPVMVVINGRACEWSRR